MSKLIKMISGGYIEVNNNKNFIPASQIIPFGTIQHISNVLSKGNKRTQNINELIAKNEKDMEAKAKKYADNMKAPYFSLEINHNFNIKRGIIEEINLKKSYVFTEAEVQLYVFNK